MAKNKRKLFGRKFNSKNHLNAVNNVFIRRKTDKQLAKTTKTSSDTALRDIQDLMHKKILVKEVGGGRSTCYMIITHDR